MSDLYWLRPGWTDARCGCCGEKIWPEGDPDWGMCYGCFSSHLDQQYPEEQYPDEPICDICNQYPAVTGVNGFGVCSEYCANEAERRGEETACHAAEVKDED